jgi:hypothetical protein
MPDVDEVLAEQIAVAIITQPDLVRARLAAAVRSDPACVQVRRDDDGAIAVKVAGELILYSHVDDLTPEPSVPGLVAHG